MPTFIAFTTLAAISTVLILLRFVPIVKTIVARWSPAKNGLDLPALFVNGFIVALGTIGSVYLTPRTAYGVPWYAGALVAIGFAVYAILAVVDWLLLRNLRKAAVSTKPKGTELERITTA